MNENGWPTTRENGDGEKRKKFVESKNKKQK